MAPIHVSAELNVLLADVFAVQLKTKNLHRHISGPHFHDYHLMLDEQGEQIFAMTDDIAERVRKLGGTTIRSIGHIARLQHVADNDAEYVEPLDMLGELREDNQALVARIFAITSVARRAMLQRQASWKTGSTRRNAGFGFYSRQVVDEHSLDLDWSVDKQAIDGQTFPDPGKGRVADNRGR